VCTHGLTAADGVLTRLLLLLLLLLQVSVTLLCAAPVAL